MSVTHAKRAEAGAVRVEVYLTEDEAEQLEELAARDGSKRAAVARAIREAHLRQRK